MDTLDAELQIIRQLIKKEDKGPTHPETIVALEALLLFISGEDMWVMTDDGERFTSLVRLIGAAFHTVATALEKEDKMQSE